MKARAGSEQGAYARSRGLFSELFAFSIPIFFSSAVQSINVSIGAIWIGHFLGTAALAAVADCNVVLMLLFAVVIGPCTVLTILIPRAAVQKEQSAIKGIVANGATFALAWSFLNAASCGLLLRPVLRMMHTPSDASEMAHAYLAVSLLVLPVNALWFVIVATLRSVGDVRTPIPFFLLSVALDALFNPLLINGYGPFPRMGVAGAAYSTLLAQVVGLSALLVFIRNGRHALWIQKAEIGYFKVDRQQWKRMCQKGGPIALQMLVVSTTTLATTSLIGRFGSQSLAAFSIVLQIWGYVQMPSLAIAASVTTLVAREAAGGRWSMVKDLVDAAVRMHLLVVGAMIALIYMVDRELIGIFFGADRDTVSLAVRLNRTVLWSYWILGVSTVIGGAMRGLGSVITPFVLLAVSVWTIQIPTAYLVSPGKEVGLVCWSIPLGSITYTIMMLLYFWFGGWRRVYMYTLP
jgi:putative MATE family efflux protein